jgi:ribonucleoside-triphosphate reductase
MCRTANGLDCNAIDNFKKNIQAVLENRPEDIDDVFSGSQKDGRGNICPVTIIMPTLAMEVIERKFKDVTDDYNEMVELAHQNKDEIVKSFMSYLDRKIHDAKDMLIERFNHIASQPSSSASFMYDNNTMSG